MKMLFTTLSPLLYLLIFLFLSSSSSSSSSSSAFTQRVAAKNMMIRCVERERLALLDFKHGLVDDFGILSSWGSDEYCCNWWGVHCNNNTGHVTMLDLHAHLDEQLRVHKVSPSILELKHLNYLDLSYNDFQGSPIPEFLGSFKRLRVLSLMEAGFSGTIPPQLGNLTNLRILNITGSNLEIKNLEWLSLLSYLRCIDFSYVHFDLSGWPETSVSLSRFLEVLHLPTCGLSEALPFLLNSSSPFLSVVDLSENNLTSSSSVFHLLRNASKQFTTIDLSRNNFVGPIPDSFGDMIFLEHLDLFGNSFTNGIPQSFGNLTHLQILSLGENQLNEPIVELFEKLSKGARKSLQTLDLSVNQLFGEFPADISTRFSSLRELDANYNQLNGGSSPLSFLLPSSLEYLDVSGNKIKGFFQDIQGCGQECDLVHFDLSNNQITGQFPDLSHFPSLRRLDLSGNQFQGDLPQTIGELSKLQYLFASSNSLKGVVTEAHFSNLTNIQELDLSFNIGLSFNLSVGWVSPFQLNGLYLANCTLGPQFPKWLQTLKNIHRLDISSSGISDTIPNWFWNISMRLLELNMSYNKIGGRLPDDLSTKLFAPQYNFDLSSNNFWGHIPSLPLGIRILNLSNNKFIGSISFLCSIIFQFTSSVDLFNNQLSGEIPDCWNNSINILILHLGSNHFSGKIPHSLGSLYRLRSLHLRNNNLTGELPSSLQNCTSLRVVDFGGNKFIGRIPSWIGECLINLFIVSLRHNKFYGNVPSSICHLNSIQILDLSGNNLTGKIPQCFNNFTYLMQNNNNSTMHAIYLRTDYCIDNILIQWKEQEWEYRKQLVFLKSIDLSNNQLIGDIPKEFSTLKGLISLNLSNNYLTGKIFPTINRMENLEALDLSRNQLSSEIPIGLAQLNFLDVLDLSNNFLSGRIPSGTQLQSFNASSYVGNMGLCGDPLPKCFTNVPPQSKNNDHQEGDSFLNSGFYISMVLGFSLSFWGIVVTLMLKDSWRSAYYKFLNEVKDWFYVRVKIYLPRLQRKLRRI